MVVAEIPLWLVHTSDSSGTNGLLNQNDGFQQMGQSNGHLESAQTSLSLLQNSGRGKKCALYSVDINPSGTRIATCGGDCTVRIWSVSSLFSKKKARFADDGHYESGEASDDSGPRDTDDNKRNPAIESQLDDIAPTNGNIVVADESQKNLVHDLSGLVRRKKGGEIHPSPTKPKPQQTLSNSPKQIPSPAKQGSPSHCQHHQRLLCTLSAHTGSSVLAVRFSSNGQYLASAGDDGAVCIHTKESGASAAIGNLTDHSAEHWSRIKLCRGHKLDVVGLAWAPDDSHLVSCSLDSENPIVVWKLTDLASNQGHITHSNVLCNPYKILGKGVHTSMVKGVTFDPAGTYLASSGDDPAICIWRAHDDWGLEHRIDADSGIFRRWKEDNAQSLSSQTLFRRLSWSTDGAFICSTNCVVKNKHVASTISRDGWNVSTAKSAAAGAANLVGHKQPVVVSRHCSQLLAARCNTKRENGDQASEGSGCSSGEEDEPNYATLLALGDRHGFVTIWSTRKSRPIFKLQCSESRCTVTDLAWGKLNDNAMLLLVSLLDGHCVALRFKIPDEVGPLLADKDQAKLFKYRYGIDLDDAGDFSRRRLLVGDSSEPKFIENALQMSLENRKEEIGDEDQQTINESEVKRNPDLNLATVNSESVKSKQTESESKGKKRIRPVLMNADSDQIPQKRHVNATNGSKEDFAKEAEKDPDPMKKAQSIAEKASSVVDSLPQQKGDGAAINNRDGSAVSLHPSSESPRHVSTTVRTSPSTNAILNYNSNRIESVDLPVVSDGKKFVASCSNAFRVPLGSKGTSLQCIDLSISQDGLVSWKDQIVGTTCSALTASKNFLAVGTSDGSVQLYSTSPTLGWACGTAFRSHPVFVFGQPVLTLQLRECQSEKTQSNPKLDLLVVTADGSFGVYDIIPDLKLQFKGSIMPAMVHMSLGTSSANATEKRLPKFSRIQLTESNHLLLLLSLSHNTGQGLSDAAPPRNAFAQNPGSASRSSYGSIQAFVYNLPLELWMRVSDGRFVLSDFYSTLPSEKSTASFANDGILSHLDDAVRTGALDSSLTPSHRSRPSASSYMYQHSEDQANYYATRSHCEDRIACALALRSSSEFKHWLTLYVRILSLNGHVEILRLLFDMLLGVFHCQTNASSSKPSICSSWHWWLSSAPDVLQLDRISLIRTVMIPEMSKNRSLQRLTNEMSLEMDSLGS